MAHRAERACARPATPRRGAAKPRQLITIRIKTDTLTKKKKYFFFEKKKQKTFALCAKPPDQMGQSGGVLNRQKFFGSFFQKRTASLLLPAFFGKSI
jgi:hypothetical protein